jgi:dienelactone hydrolase
MPWLEVMWDAWDSMVCWHSVSEEEHAMRERRGFSFGVVVSLVLTVVIGVSPAHGQPTSPSAVHVTFPDTAGTLQLPGLLYRPDGPGAFPAVVALHGCGGIQLLHHRWAHTLHQWGYVALLVDSLSPRGKTTICASRLSVDPQYVRMPDAYAAQAYLARQPFVDSTRIAVMGWSHGGSTALYAVDHIYLERINAVPFKAAIALYPGCLLRLLRVNAPLLILIGEDDDWTPASRCKNMVSQSEQWGDKTAHGVTLKVYPGAPHGFDGLLPPGSYYGHTCGRHPEAAAQAEEEVKRFLAHHLGIQPQTP